MINKYTIDNHGAMWRKFFTGEAPNTWWGSAINKLWEEGDNERDITLVSNHNRIKDHIKNIMWNHP
jgi:hypothetical protein